MKFPKSLTMLALVCGASCASHPPVSTTPASMPATSPALPTIAIDAQFVAAIRSGKKQMTVRNGHRNYPLGPAIMKSPTETIPIEITALEYKAFGELNDEDARAEGLGMTSAADLKKGLLVFYPNLKPADPVTIVRFRTR